MKEEEEDNYKLRYTVQKTDRQVGWALLERFGQAQGIWAWTSRDLGCEHHIGRIT